MSKQRLSKLQKWILEHCFRVTILLDRTTLKRLNNIGSSRKCWDCSKTNESVRLKIEQDMITPRCVKDGSICTYFWFYKEDILLSFFSLKPNNDITHFSRVQHFYDSSDYAKAHVTVHRSINNLGDKGLVSCGSVYREDSLCIWLTDDGIQTSND